MQFRLIPCFAVVSAPMLALNLRDYLERTFDLRERQTAQWLRGQKLLRGLAIGISLVLLVCAWPGWLQAPPYEPRHWGIDIAPGLAKSADLLVRWRQEGAIAPEARGLHWSSESSNYFDWACPEDRGLRVDQLIPGSARKQNALFDFDKMQNRMRDEGINHFLVRDADRARMILVLSGLLSAPEHWPLLAIDGDTAIFGWRDPRREADAFHELQNDINQLAFRPELVKKAPDSHPARESQPRQWYEAFWKPFPLRSSDSNEAAFWLLYSEATLFGGEQRFYALWETSQSAALAGGAMEWSAPSAVFGMFSRLTTFQPALPPQGRPLRPGVDREVFRLQARFTENGDRMPPAALYLAVRAARRAVSESPDDVQAYLCLGESYVNLLNNTRERGWQQRFPQFADLRRAQASAALNEAIARQPDFAPAHLLLVQLYSDISFRDLALRHMRIHSRLTHGAGAPPGMTRQQFQELEAAREKRLEEIARDVADRERAFAAEAPKLRVLDRALLAMEKGLAGKALEILSNSDVAAFGPEGMARELDLLLRTGGAKQVRDWTDPIMKGSLGEPGYYWNRVQALAATGDYKLAIEECRNLAISAQLAGHQFRDDILVEVGKSILNEQPGVDSGASRMLTLLQRANFLRDVAGLAARMRRQADSIVIRGILALEQGDLEEAEIAFRTALAIWKNDQTAQSGGGLDFSSRVIAQRCLAWLE
jgi:tetratricopeptide (TPR) repeat protein